MCPLGTLIRREDLLAVRDLETCFDCTLECCKDSCSRRCPVETDIKNCTSLLCFLCFYRKEHARKVCRRCAGSRSLVSVFFQLGRICCYEGTVAVHLSRNELHDDVPV